MADDPDLVAELYGAPLEEFVAERTKLARKLRDEGRDDESKEIASLRKPTLPAYLANRLAHDRPQDVKGLLDAAQKLASAHGSGDPEKLRRAQTDLAERVQALVALASDVSGREVSEPVEHRLAETLRAAATDRESAPLLRRGVLQEEVETSGFEALAGVKLAPAKGGASKAAPARWRAKGDPRVGQLRKDLAAARQEASSAEAALKTAEREATRARKRVSDLEARLERLS